MMRELRQLLLREIASDRVYWSFVLGCLALFVVFSLTIGELP